MALQEQALPLPGVTPDRTGQYRTDHLLVADMVERGSRVLDVGCGDGELLQLLENIHGETTHVGKIPKRSPQSSQIQFKLIKLRNELRIAIEEERYEDAAKIRDSIRLIEEDQSKAESAGTSSEPAP